MNFWKRQLPAIIVFLMGMLMVIQFYIPHPISYAALEESNRWVRIIRNFALLLGVLSLIGNHWRKINRKQKGFGYSIIVFVFFISMTFSGLKWGIDAPRDLNYTINIPAEVMQNGGEVSSAIRFKYKTWSDITLSLLEGMEAPKGEITARVNNNKDNVPLSIDEPTKFYDKGELILVIPPGAGTETLTLKCNLKETRSPGNWLFKYIKVSMESTMYSLLAFFIASAAFRAFRARSFDATVMLIAAIVMMVGRIPFGESISSIFSDNFLIFPETASWLLAVPVTAAKRAIFLGIALSVIATSIRVIFGLERSYLGKGD